MHSSPHPNPVAKVAFTLILLTPLAFPGSFPFDVNLILAACAAFLFISIFTFELRYLYLPRYFSFALIIILGLQVYSFVNGDLLAPEIWKLQTVGYLAASAMLVAGISAPATSLLTWMHLYMSVAVLWSSIGLIVWLGATSGMALGIGPVAFTMEPAIKLAGPFNQGNIFAAAIGFAWIFAHWLFIVEKKYIYAMSIIFFTAMLFDSMSRGGWLSYIPAVILLLYALKPKTSFYLQWLLPLWGIGLALGYLCLMFSQPQLESQLLLAAIPSAGASLSERLIYWASAMVEFLNAPWAGVGWGQFPTEFWIASPQAQSWFQLNFGWNHSPTANALSAHNLILHVLAEGGLITAFLLLWGIWKIFLTSMVWIKKANSARLPFALAALAFILQSQINIVFTRPIPLLMAAFFTGIALAPWLRKNSWKFTLQPFFRNTALAVAMISVLWATQLSYQWFSVEQAMRNLDINHKASVERLVKFTTMPRIGTVSLVWLGYIVATERKHAALLVWMLPYLKESAHEIPSVSTYQVLFYALITANKLDEACQLGKTISLQRFPGEINNPAYIGVCEGRIPSRYRFGY